MNNLVLDQKCRIVSTKAVDTTTNVQRRTHTTIAEGSILERLMDFAFSIPDFRRTGRGNQYRLHINGKNIFQRFKDLWQSLKQTISRGIRR